MNEEVVSKQMLEVLTKIGSGNVPEGTYLAGGTALALELGHRKSKDVDLFTGKEFAVDQWRQKWEQSLGFAMFNQDWQTLEGEAGGVKMALYHYKYPLIERTEKYRGVEIASLEDIAAMKLEALVNRGTKRDFVDVYFLAKKFGLKAMFGYYDRKYGNLEEREILIAKALVFFEDADEDEMPDMLQPTSWEEIKKYFEKMVV